MSSLELSPPATTAKAGNVTPVDTRWYQDAIIYQLHVRSFHDQNGDGIGDFRGLTEKLDYVQSLGVTAIWLLPFFKSPLRDGGYDISDYTDINPDYGTLEDFEEFVQEAHGRDLKVITELVMNHTSDQHEWFQRSRRAKPGEEWRDFYVWSDTDDRYPEARIIFQDFETSNWTWDPVAEAYFWHRFYHHQPNLNFENPKVHEAILAVVDFWLEKGVDGVRLDAVPYLYQREGTNCENLPETHAFLKKLRRHVDSRYPGRMLLAEANQWPEDAAAYFGDGDECHMNFHFPLMPRLFMAIEREDRFPIIDILEQTPHIPENCQWGIFLRNHDELTLEMVTDEERDYMYRAYADDLRARLNLGIRRRLAPLMRDHRGKIELINALLLSLPGTPIIYYGDEIRMGDNIYLGDRDGVRTPMQWSEDRNAGFSRANPQQLFLPVIIDRTFHYTARNVELEQSNPNSLLWWMRRILTLRKQMPVFGRGSIEFLQPDNFKVLAYLREHEDETILVVANLSRQVQCAEIDLSRFQGKTLLELFGQTKFPPVGSAPYFLTLAPCGFYWLRVQPDSEARDPAADPPAVIRLRESWDELFQGRPLATLEAALPAYLQRQRWFSGKARPIQHVSLLDVIRLEDGAIQEEADDDETCVPRILIAQINFLEGEPDIYVLPFVLDRVDENRLPASGCQVPGLILISGPEETTYALADATREPEFWRTLHRLVATGKGVASQVGQLTTFQTEKADVISAQDSREGIQIFGVEQSNSSAAIDAQFVLKMFRRIAPGENPDLEIGRYLTEQAQLPCVPEVVGAVEYRRSRELLYTLAVLHEYVNNEGDAWSYTLDELDRFLERVESGLQIGADTEGMVRDVSLVQMAEATPPESIQEALGSYLKTAELLGKRTGQLHVALAAGEEEAFAPLSFTRLYQRSLYQSIRSQVRRSLSLLNRRLDRLPENVRDLADHVLRHEDILLERCRGISDRPIKAQRTRNHGDFHLGQVLFTGKDFMIVDFEGEPARPLSERRIKASPLRDVAGMLRSFHYASKAVVYGPKGAWLENSSGREGARHLLDVWYIWSAASYLKGYFREASKGNFLPENTEHYGILLDGYLVEKAAYELVYELNNRPAWVQVPLEGILRLLQEGGQS